MKIDSATSAKVDKIKMVIFDVDGVLTDGGLYYFNDGNFAKKFYVKDGTGIRRLQDKGFAVAFITGLESNAVNQRAAHLGVNHVIQNCRNKVEATSQLILKLGFEWNEVAYLGDDLIDLDVMKKVGLPVAVADAVDEILDVAILVTSKPGGRGAARELCDLFLNRQ